MKRMKQGLIGWLKSLGANLGTTNNQGRRLGRRRTTNSSKKKTDGDHSINRCQTIIDVATRSGTT
jgi:hypothetical protein